MKLLPNGGRKADDPQTKDGILRAALGSSEKKIAIYDNFSRKKINLPIWLGKRPC
jgi:hypothetical protein